MEQPEKTQPEQDAGAEVARIAKLPKGLRMYSVEEFAWIAHCQPSTVHQLMATEPSRLPQSHMNGRRVLFLEKDVLEWICALPTREQALARRKTQPRKKKAESRKAKR